jgi:hypothetical protein
MVFATLLYAGSLLFAYTEYLYPIWGYYGFLYYEPQFYELAFGAMLLILVSILLPPFLSRPSAIILSILHCVVLVPSIVVTLCVSPNALADYWGVLLALCAGFALAASLVRTFPPRPCPQAGLFSTDLSLAFLLAWLVLFAALFVAYGAIMRFASLEEVYEQRAVAGTLAGTALSYVSSLFGVFLSPALLAIGLTRRKLLYCALGVSGCVVIYMISAQRTAILLPIVIVLVFFAIRKGKSALSLAAVLPAFLAACVFAIVLNLTYQPDGDPLAIYVVFRTLAIPGLTLSQYFDVFSANGFTYWSHVKGISLLVPPPLAFADDKLWPGLGYIVGDRVYGNPILNANANLFSGDGAAAAGALGIIVISTVLGLWLLALDRIAAKWDQRFAMLAVTPIAIQLTNGHFFTMMLSFGGLLWMLVLYYARPSTGPRFPLSAAPRLSDPRLRQSFHPRP